MIPSITCYIPPSVERLGPRPTNFSNPDPRPPQISNQIDAPVCYPQHPPPDPYSTGINLLFHCPCLRNRNRNRKIQTSKAPLKSQAQGTSLFTSAASNQRGFPKNSPWDAQVRFPEGERMRQIRGVFQRIVRGKLRSGCQKVRGGRLGVKAGVV